MLVSRVPVVVPIPGVMVVRSIVRPATVRAPALRLHPTRSRRTRSGAPLLSTLVGVGPKAHGKSRP